MKPVVSVGEMRAVDEAAPVPVEELIDRAGRAVARTALGMLGGAYGRRVVVLAGKGNNGADGRVAADRLRRRGVRVEIVDVADAADRLPPADLVVDAAYGTGFRGTFDAPDPCGAPVLAVDIPSGIDGDTGVASGSPMCADVTVTFAAHKPGLLLGDGPELAGRVEVADIGLDVSGASMHLLEDADARGALVPRRRNDHKWLSAVLVVGGSPGLVGAPWLAAATALRTGAGNVRIGIPGADGWEIPPSEVYSRILPQEGWADQALKDAERCRAVVIGPGLGLDDATGVDLAAFLAAADRPVVCDADALTHIARSDGRMLEDRPDVTILTPHEGEFERLAGRMPGPDRIADTRALASRTGAIVLLKGPTTVVAHPDGRVLLAAAGSPALATAGSGDTLAGAIGAFVARGADPFLSTAAAAHAHGAAASAAHHGLAAGDLARLIPEWLGRID